MTNDRLRDGIEAMQAGDRRRARRLLGQAVNEDPNNVAAWWYLAAALEDTEQRVHSLRQVLRLQPDHEEARRILSQLERRVAQVTPAEGTPRPVLDTHQDTHGDLVVVPGEEPPPARRARASDTMVAGMAVGLALASILVTVILMWTGVIGGVPGGSGPGVEPTLRPLVFDIPACSVSDSDEAVIVFINNSPVLIEMLRGEPGEEEFVVALAPGAQSTVETPAGVPVRYYASTQAEGYTGGGARIEVPAGNACRVPIR
jgi:hypothetical protein